MSNVIIASITMTSLELVDFINDDRQSRAHSNGAAFPSPGFAKLEHADFLKKVPLVLGQDHAGKFSETVYRVNPSGGRPIPSPGYRFPKREACLMAMSYSYELQAKVFDRMTALEQSSQTPTLPNFSDPVAAARAWADAKEGEQIAVAQLALAAPKVEFVDRYVQPGTGSMGLREVCKMLGAKQNQFTDFLLARGLMYRTLAGVLTPKAEHIHNGRFEAKTGTAEHGETSHAYVHYKFSPKGVTWIAGLWGQHKAKLAQQVEV